MDPFIIFASGDTLYYAAPLIAAISLVYAATRHEQPLPILKHAGRVAAWIVGVMVAISVVIWLILSRL